MINYTFKIDTHDGKGLRVLPIKPFQGNSDIRVLGEELDSGFMVLWLKNRENLPIMSYVEYTIEDETGSITRKFYIGNDNTNRVSKSKNYYEHKLELIELTKKLEKYLEGTICFTQPTEIGKTNYTLRTCIERILRIFPLGIDRLNNDYRDTSTNINVYPKPNNRIIQGIDVDLSSFLDTIQAPQFVFTNPTLREAIDGVLKYVNAVAKLDTYYNMPNVTTVHNKIGAEFYGYLRKLINTDNIYTYNISQNIEDYASKSKSYVKNMNLENFQENGQYIQYPYSYKLDDIDYNGEIGDRIKSSDNEYSINDSNCGILTQFPIKSVLSLQIPIAIHEVYTTDLSKEEKIYFTDLQLKTNSISLELSDNVLEEEIFLNLTDEEKGQYFHYKINNNFIDCSSSFKGILFNTSSVIHVIQKSFVNFLNSNAIPLNNVFGYRFKLRFLSDGDKDIDFYVFNDENNTFVEGGVTTKGNANFHKHARYRITYISQTNSIISVENENLYDVNVNTQNNINQEDRVISFSNFTNTLYSLSQRTGTRDLEVTCKHFNVSDLIDIGDYTSDNYICTKAEYIYYNNFIIGKYIFDRNYNRISSYIGINADIRQYEIPTGKDTYERQCEIDSYVEISRENNIQEDVEHTFNQINIPLVSTLGAYNKKTDIYHYIGLKLALITYDSNFTYNKEINDYFTELTNYNYPALKLECFGKGEKNILSFDFGFNDNINAGEFVKSSVEGIFEDIKLIKQKVPYCMYYGDKIGFLRNLNIKLISQNVSDYSDYLPLVSYETVNNTLYKKSFIDINNLMVLKDPSEILKFTYKMNFISLDEKITLGKWFFENNYIFKNITETVENTNNITFDLYYSKNKYSKYDMGKITENLTSQISWNNFSDVSPLINGNAKDEDSADFYIQFNKDVMPTIPNTTKTIIIANGKDIVMTIAYDPLNLDENGENEIYKPIYFNFRTKRSKIVYEY